MIHKVQFHFYGSLTDFLSTGRSGHVLCYTFTEAPSVKDAIEAHGVPHPEVEKILVNGTCVTFHYQLQPNDKIEVYPAVKGLKACCTTGCCNVKFVLDVHLGKLAKALRMLGFDTSYHNSYTDKYIATLAEAENRIVLTRDVGLLKHKIIERGYWLRSQHPEEQLLEVIKYFGLKEYFRPLTRCLVCNSGLQQVDKNSVYNLLPPKTKLYFHEFYRCPDCLRIYWKGSHYEHMEGFINKLSAA